MDWTEERDAALTDALDRVETTAGTLPNGHMLVAVGDLRDLQAAWLAAEASVARLNGYIAAQECDRLEGLEAENKRLRDMTDALAGGQASVEDLLFDDVMRARLARLEDDVVELTQAGDLHRKEGDEARALLREAFPFVEATTRRAHAQGGYNLLRRMGACLAADTYAPVEPSSAAEYVPRYVPRTVLAEVHAKLDRLGRGEPIPDTVHTTRISHGISASDVYRRCLQVRPSWALILLEEVSEAVEAIGDATALRAELVQVAAVATAWAEAIDRRQEGAP